MRKNLRKKLLLLLTAVLFPALLLSACEVFMPTPTPDLPVQGPPSANPFTLRMESEDGTVVEMAGPSSNLEPGSQAGYQLSIFNGSDELWEDSFCIVLLDTEGIAALLAEDNFSISPRDGISTHIQVAFPQDLQPAPYALSFIIPDRWATVSTIYLGDTHRESAGPWPQVSQCP